MKQLIAVIIALAVPISFFGCGSPSNVPSSAAVASSGSGGSGTDGGSGGSGSGGNGSGNNGGGDSGNGGGSGGSGSGSGGSGSSGGGSGSGGSGSGSGGSGSSNTTGTVVSNIQTASGNWISRGQAPPDYADCATPSPCGGITWSMDYGVSTPSRSGNATKFSLGGTTAYGDALFSAQLIGQNAPQLRDANHKLLPTLHNFVYDSDFYVTDASITQVLEFDINMYMNGLGMVWGNQCNYLGSKQWDIWDNANAKWVPAGVPCKFVNGWNHVTIQVERESDNTLLYQSITLNGTTYTLNETSPPGSVDYKWWGVTANYQMDGNYKQSANSTFLDNFTLRYW